MSIIADSIRPFWLKGINEITGNVTKDFSAWLLEQDFQVYTQIHQDEAILTISSEVPLVLAFAAESIRFSAAAFESASGIIPDTVLPKSCGWHGLRTYYAAFFAAHSILRMLGTTCSYLRSDHLTAIAEIADLFNNRNGMSLGAGFFHCSYDSASHELTCKKLAAKGSHSVMWQVFHDKLHAISESILTQGPSSLETQSAADKLSEICQALNSGSTEGTGGWLSQIRNRVNYRHELATWYPYRAQARYYTALYQRTDLWRTDPSLISIWSKDREIQRFFETCSAIVSICRELCSDMSGRCPQGQSFQVYGPLNLLNRLPQPST